MHIYIYLPTQQTGNEINSFFCGNGPVSIKIFRNKLLFIGCYDGFVYVLDKQSGQRVGRFPGSGKMILALEIVGDKVNNLQFDLNKFTSTDNLSCILAGVDFVQRQCNANCRYSKIYTNPNKVKW